MYRKVILLAFFGLSIIFWGQVWAQNLSINDNSYVQNFDNGKIDWQTGLVTAVGTAAPPANTMNLDQARALALRAATVVARRNLLEIIKVVQIDSATSVANCMVANNITLTQVRGFLQNSQILDTAYLSDGSVEVTVGVSLRGGLASVIIPKTIPFRPKINKSEPVQQELLTPDLPVFSLVEEAGAQPQSEVEIEAPRTIYSGLLVDARGLGARPAMIPKILDENGMEVYGSALVSREYAVQQGMVGYAKDLVKASQNPRVADTPFIVKAIAAKGKAKTDLVIPNDKADELRSLAKNHRFLEKCRVMIILD
jgi:hypothetical protein